MAAGYSALRIHKTTKVVSWSGDDETLNYTTYAFLREDTDTDTPTWHDAGNIGTGTGRILVINRSTKVISWDVGTNWSWTS